MYLITLMLIPMILAVALAALVVTGMLGDTPLAHAHPILAWMCISAAWVCIMRPTMELIDRLDDLVDRWVRSWR